MQITKNRKSYINNTEINSTDFINNYLYPPASNNNVKEYAQQSSPATQPHKRTVATHSIDDQLTKLRGSINRDYQYTDDGDLKSMTNCFGTTNYDYDVFGNLKYNQLKLAAILDENKSPKLIYTTWILGRPLSLQSLLADSRSDFKWVLTA